MNGASLSDPRFNEAPLLNASAVVCTGAFADIPDESDTGDRPSRP